MCHGHIVTFSMAGLCRGQNRHSMIGLNVSWSESSLSAWLECVVVQIITLSMAGMCRGLNRHFQHGWNVTWSKSPLSAWLTCDLFKIVTSACLDCAWVRIDTFSMAGISPGPNQHSEHGWNVSGVYSSLSAWLECDIVKIVTFSMSEM